MLWPPKLASFPKIYLGAFLSLRGVCAKVDVTMATEFSQQCFLKGIFFEKGFILFLVLCNLIPRTLFPGKAPWGRGWVLWNLTNFSILPVTLLFNYISLYDNLIWILPVNSIIWRRYDVKLHHCTNRIKLCLDAGNDRCIILCSFGSRIMSAFEGKLGDL